MKQPAPAYIQMLAFVALLAAAVEVRAGDAPQIIFISENQSAESAAREIVQREYNARQREALRETNFEAWENYENVDWRLIPPEFRDARFAEILDTLGLAPDDPADKGFTDFLEAQGFDVYRSWTERESDPITGATTETHEFWGSTESDDPNQNFFLSESQLERLSAADLIIMSPNISPNPYSWSGRENGSSSTVLIEQWNGLDVPIIAMNTRLILTNEFGSWGWGWSYGFPGSLTTSLRPRLFDAIAAYDRQEETPAELERFVFPDFRPKVRRSDSPLLANLSPLDDDRLAIYKDYALFPILPRTPKKFSHNDNYTFPANVRVVLEIDVPTFFMSGLNISSRDPVLLEVDAGIRFFQPTGMPSERVGMSAERRIFLAAGMGDTGLYNLSETGEQLFMNLVTQFTQPAGVTDTWAGLPIEADGTVVTKAFGTIFPLEDYAFAYRLEAWVYLPEAFVTENGAWVFGSGWEDLPVHGSGWFEDTPLGMIHMDTAAGFLYIHSAGHWAYPAEHVENGGRWIFLFGDS